MADSRKKVIVRTLGGLLHPGYLPLSGLLDSPATSVSLLDLEARILPIPLASVRHIAYVRDFNLNDPSDPERLTRRTFLARPRTEGLWLRLTLPGPEGLPPPEILEGLAPLDLSLLDMLQHDRGLFLLPPDIRSNTQRLYIPRTAILDLRLLAVITNPSRPRPTPQKRPAASPQPTLFP